MLLSKLAVFRLQVHCRLKTEERRKLAERQTGFGTKKKRRRRIREKSEKEIVGWRPVDDAQGRAIIQR